MSLIVLPNYNKIIMNFEVNTTHLFTSILGWTLYNKSYGYNHMSTLHATLSTLLSVFLISVEGSEEYLTYLMVGYFFADLVNVFRNYDLFIHHLFCIFCIFYINNFIPHDNSYESNIISKVCLLEISTPFLNLYKRTKKMVYGVLLLITFFLFRIIWLTHFVSKIFVSIPTHVLGHYERITIIFFVLLNYWWFSKILRISYSKFSKNE